MNIKQLLESTEIKESIEIIVQMRGNVLFNMNKTMKNQRIFREKLKR